ncbi:MAG: hypothetical protein PF637_11385 [Spirochaetes bacterium]|nr:hypothetical protein [Spirochaetota bacterium]
MKCRPVLYIIWMLISFIPAKVLLCESQVWVDVKNYSYMVNNSDFNSYDYSTFKQEKIDYKKNSDDLSLFYFSSVGVSMTHETEKLIYSCKLDKTFLWGGRDKFESDRRGFSVYELSANIMPGSSVSIRAGRFYYQLGGAMYEYVLNDVMDGVALDCEIPVGSNMFVFKTHAEVYSQHGKPAGPYSSLSSDSNGSDSDNDYSNNIVDDFNGDTTSYRLGLVIGFNYVRAFGYFLRYGASRSGGAEIAENGRSDVNRSDEDFLSLSGVRISSWQKTLLSWDVTSLFSYGRNSHYSNQKTYQGHALLAAINLGQKHADDWNHFYIHAGAYSSGFCGMRSSVPGGTLLGLMKGYTGSPIADYNGFRDYSDNSWQEGGIDKTVPKLFAQSGGRIGFYSLIADTSLLVLFANESDNPVLPDTGSIGYMGIECELKLSYVFSGITVALSGAVFKPSDYYSNKEKILSASGTDIFYSLFATCEYGFFL